MKTWNTEMIIEFTTTLPDLLHAAREWEARYCKVANRIVSISECTLYITKRVLNSSEESKQLRERLREAIPGNNK